MATHSPSKKKPSSKWDSSYGFLGFIVSMSKAKQIKSNNLHHYYYHHYNHYHCGILAVSLPEWCVRAIAKVTRKKKFWLAPEQTLRWRDRRRPRGRGRTCRRWPKPAAAGRWARRRRCATTRSVGSSWGHPAVLKMERRNLLFLLALGFVLTALGWPPFAALSVFNQRVTVVIYL